MARGAGGYPPRAPAPKKRNSAARQAFFNVAAMTTQTSGRQILDQVHADGATIWVERSSRAEFNKQGKLQRIVGMVVDITERKRAEEQLQVQLHRAPD